jgi:glycosyltransferase involved in cell wall biosynthesis
MKESKQHQKRQCLMLEKKSLVLHLITRLDAGGSALSTVVVSDKIRNYNFDSELIFGATSDSEGKIRNDLERRRLKFCELPELVRNPAPVRDIKALIGLIKIIREKQPAIIHTHTSKAGTLGRIAAWWAGIPVVHTPHGNIFYGYFSKPVTSFYVVIERLLARITDKFISLTDNETKDALNRRIGSSDQYVTIPSGVPIKHFHSIPEELGLAFRKENVVPENAILFVSIGRLEPVKGFDILLQAFAVASKGRNDMYLMIVGDGNESAALKSLAELLGIAKYVRFAGAMDDVRQALAAADIFVLASRNEGMGRVIVEALAAGLPVIGSNVCGIASLIKHNVNGLLVRSLDIEAFATAMLELAGDHNKRKALSSKGWESVYPEYDEDFVAERTAFLYKELLKAT